MQAVKRRSRLFLALLSSIVVCFARPAGATGPYIAPLWKDFKYPSYSTIDYLVGTYYFFWYDYLNGYHLVNADGSDALTEHPLESLPAPLGAGGYAARPPAIYYWPPYFSMQDTSWHARECQRIAEAGIDFILPVYWGMPNVRDWNTTGIAALNTALEGMEARQQKRPAVGMFYDTTTLSGVDLTTKAGKDQFYGTIRDFFSYLHPKRWMRLNGRALVWFYWSGWPSRLDGSVLQQASDRFAKEFGGVRLFFVGDTGWRNAGNPLDLTYSWGAAVSGTTINDVTAIGAGYDDRAVTYRNPNLVVSRENGNFYRRAWESAHGSGRRILALETWNEYHEGTEIAPTYEFGWLYWNITKDETKRHRFPIWFVRQGFHYFMRRGADPGGLQAHTNAMDQGWTCGNIRDRMANAEEARARRIDSVYVTFLYQNYLKRAPDSGGYANWLNQLAKGMRRSDARDGFLNSAEARSRVSNAQFVTELYRQILGREADTGGYNYWLGQLNTGKSRAFVRDGFVNSVELRYHDFAQKTQQQLAALFDFSGWK